MERTQKTLFLIGITLLFMVAGSIFAFGIGKINSWRKEKSEKLLIQSQNIENAERSLVYLQEAAFLNPSEFTYLYAGVKAQEAGLDNISTYYLKRVKTALGFRELGNAYYESDKFDLAERAYKKSLEKENSADTWYLVGKNYMKQAKNLEANYAFNKSVELDENNFDAEYLKTISNLVKDESIKPNLTVLNESYKQKIEELISSPASSTRINRIFSQLKSQGFPQLAIQYLKDKGQDGMLDRDGYLLLANELFMGGDFQSSYQALLKAKDRDPYYPQTYQHLVEVARKLGKAEEEKQYKNYLNKITW